MAILSQFDSFNIILISDNKISFLSKSDYFEIIQIFTKISNIHKSYAFRFSVLNLNNINNFS